MSKRKGLSLEEKRSKMLELFYEKKEFFQLKELERLGPKEKGVISQSVKDVVQSLVDDGLVDTDKIGTCVYFWSFPSKASSIRLNKVSDLEQKLAVTASKISTNMEKLQEAKVGREDSESREAAMMKLNTVLKRKQQMSEEMQNFSDCSPEYISQRKQDIQVAVEAINRWTDNIFTIRSWCRNKFCIEESALNKQFQIPEELDYV